MKQIVLVIILLLPTTRLLAQEKQQDKKWEIDPLKQPSFTLRCMPLVQPTAILWTDVPVLGPRKRKLMDVSAACGILQDYPMNRHLTVGFGMQLFLLSPIRKDRITHISADMTGFLRPRIPVRIGTNKIIAFYANTELGLAMLHILFKYKGAREVSRPFAWVAGVVLGAEYIFNSWMAVYLEAGLRSYQVAHKLTIPFDQRWDTNHVWGRNEQEIEESRRRIAAAKEESRRRIAAAKQEKNNFFYYNIITVPIAVGFKLFI